jgi:hypothetical protein
VKSNKEQLADTMKNNIQKSDQLWATYTRDSPEFWKKYESLIVASKKNALPKRKPNNVALSKRIGYTKEGVQAFLMACAFVGAFIWLGFNGKQPRYTPAKLPVTFEEQYDLPGAIHLDLSNKKHRVMPQEIAQAQSLKTLIMNKCGMYKLADNIGKLSKLQIVDVKYNYLATLPESMAQLQQLKYLDLSKNSLEHVPEVITQLKNLQVLDLSHNEITSLPYAIRDLQKLNKLDISHNKITQLPESINLLPNLEVLIISDNQLNELPLYMDKLPKLKLIKLKGNQFNYLPKQLGKLKKRGDAYE